MVSPQAQADWLAVFKEPLNLTYVQVWPDSHVYSAIAQAAGQGPGYITEGPAPEDPNEISWIDAMGLVYGQDVEAALRVEIPKWGLPTLGISTTVIVAVVALVLIVKYG